MRKKILFICGFLLFIIGLSSLFLGFSGVVFSFMKFIEPLGPIYAFAIKLFISILGIVLAYFAYLDDGLSSEIE